MLLTPTLGLRCDTKADVKCFLNKYFEYPDFSQKFSLTNTKHTGLLRN